MKIPLRLITAFCLLSLIFSGFSVHKIFAQSVSPDLAIKSLTFDPQSGRPILTVINQGQAEAYTALTSSTGNSRLSGNASTVEIRYLKSNFLPTPNYTLIGTPERFQLPRPFNPGATKQFNSAINPPAGATHVEVTVDSENIIVESNETNNSQTQILPNVTAPNTNYADLEISSFDFVTGSSRPKVTYKNSGLGSVASSLRAAIGGGSLSNSSPDVRISYLKSDFQPSPHYTQLGTPERFSIPALNPQATQTVTAANNPPAGATHAKVELDSGDNIIETNEDNNSQIKLLPGVTAPTISYPDLAIQSFNIDPQTSLPTVTFTNQGQADIYSTLNNQSGGQFSGRIPSVKFSYLSSDFGADNNYRIIGTAESFPINHPFGPGATQTITARGPVPSSATHIKVELNFDNTVIESDSANDQNNSQVKELATGDLVIESLVKKDATTATLAIKNQGSAPVKIGGKDLLISFDTGSGAQNKSFAVSADLPPAATLSYDLPLTSQAIKASAQVDPNNWIDESDNDNNSINVTFLVAKKGADALIKNDDKFILGKIKESTPAASVPLVSAIASINVLPCSPLYTVKNVGKGLESLFTSGDDNKAKLDLANANQKTLEAASLASKGKNDCAAGALADASKDVAATNELVDSINKTSPDKAKEIAAVAVEDQLLQQKVTGSILKNSTDDSVAKLTTTRDESLNNLAKSVEQLSDQSRIKQAIAASDKDNPDPLSSVSNLEVLTSLQDKLSINNKDLVEGARDDAVVEVKQNLQSLPDDSKSLFTDYVKGIGGADTSKLKLVDSVRLAGVDANSKTTLLNTTSDVTQNLSDKLSKLPDKNKVSDSKVILSDLSDGSVEDLRVLSDLDQSIGAKNKEAFDSVKKDSADNFAKQLNSLSDSQKTAFAKETAQNFTDLKQVKVYKQLSDSADGSDKKNLDDLNSALNSEIQQRVNDTNPYANKEFLATFSDRSASDLRDLKDLQVSFDKDTYSKIMTSQMDLLKTELSTNKDESAQYSDLFNDPTYQQFLKAYSSYFEGLAKYFQNYNWSANDSDNTVPDDTTDNSDQSQNDQTPPPDDSPTPQESAPAATPNETTSDDAAPDSPVLSTDNCISSYDPVCGTDGLIYNNACEATAEHMTIAYKGECKDDSNN